jgi:uncharacterized Zn-binding protein involved in type VI secretion
MAELAHKDVMSTGEDGFPPSSLTTIIQCTKSYVGGKLIATVGDQFTDHGPSPQHTGVKRKISAGASKTFFEGRAAARKGDSLADGDKIASGNVKTIVE